MPTGVAISLGESGFSTIRGMAELDILRCLPWYKLSLYASEPGAHHLEEVPERDQCAGVGAQGDL